MIKNLNVIIPFDASEQEKFACEELKSFLREVSDVQLNIITDNVNDLAKPFISIGKTKVFSQDIKDFNLLERVGEDGYRIVVKNDCAYVCGGAGQGTIFGVYGLLNKLFNLVIYTENVYTYDFKPFEFIACDIISKPDIPMRALGIYPVHLEKREPNMGNKRYCYRMRLRQMDEGWGINNHSYFRVIPPSVYKEKHPEWYDQTGKQLCLTNEELIAEYVKNMKKIIEDTPNDSLYMFGMEDTLNQCHCPKCKEMIDKYGYSTLTLIFANRLAKELNAWIKVAHPERKVYFFTFAYVWAIEPPVEKLPDGTFKPKFDLDLEDNMGVLIAPLYTSTNYAWNDPRAKEALTTNYYEKQISVVDIFNGWKSIVNNVAVWCYNHNFADYMSPCPMWANIKENFKWFSDLGAIHVFMEAGCCETSNFAQMKIFVCSNLMWNTSLNQTALIRQFMSIFYQGAETELYDYFSYIHEHAIWLKENLNREMIFVQFDDEPNGRLMDRRFWPKNMLLKCLKYFDNALKKDLTEEVSDRVKIEALPVKFSLLELYRKELDKAFALKLIDDVLEASQKSGMKDAITEKPFTFVGFAELWKKDLL